MIRAFRKTQKLGDQATSLDTLLCQLWEGLQDKEGIKDPDAMAELVDARAIGVISETIAKAMEIAQPEVPTKPASESAN